MDLRRTLSTGFRKGLDTTWTLLRITLPVYFVVRLLEATPLLGWLSRLFEPLMGLFGLPGEASLVLVIGNVLSLYAAIGALGAMSFDSVQVTVLALMLSFSHSLPVESALAHRLGLSVPLVVAFRLGLAVLTGMAAHLTLAVA
ncbi:nucleoside recognition protein [Aminithiophilus ramosus]|uniref:Nucleoside recognition protein n=2 Tax=Synergistales TaxID=649776 RepID=A0A9Q7AE92_9BACT|nr:nucleoside recognition domain-containing protein [Aminithiophilus ramosus]QTX32729.1 nucleoside recognition protein [Aminithiophilus ramosus]QVL36606.1 nucleoside recognition protein [Synergistota bacterium]